MGACHAVAKRLQHEALGLIPAPAGSAVQLPPLAPPAVLDMAPNFADDGLLAGRSDEVLRALTHLKMIMPTLGLRFSTLQLIPAAGQAHSIDLDPFKTLGCSVQEDGNFEVLKSPLGTDGYCKEFCAKLVEKQREIFEFLATLGDPQVTHYLLKNSVNASRMNYLARTTPPAICADAAQAFDGAVIQAASAALGQQWNESQIEQASFSTKDGGLGLRSVASSLGSAYIGSRSATHALCTGIRPLHRWDDGVASSPLALALEQVQSATDNAPIFGGSIEVLTQGRIGKLLKAKQLEKWKRSCGPDVRVRQNAFSAKGGGEMFEVTPSKTLDTQLTSSEFATNVACTLGVDVLDAGAPCNMCGMMQDCAGIHALSCMSGGDQVYEHNAVRDVIFDFCERGRLRPKLEEPNLLASGSQANSRERPADVLVIPHIALARQLPDGSRAIRAERVCFDFAVINALGANHWSLTADVGGQAAEEYDSFKRRRNNTEERCAQQGLRFWPVVLEQQGGMSKAADTALRAIAVAVATCEGLDEQVIRRAIMQRISVVIARSVGSRVARRVRSAPCARPAWAAAAPNLGYLAQGGDEEADERTIASAAVPRCVALAAAQDVRLQSTR
jgi:hypothetical protein